MELPYLTEALEQVDARAERLAARTDQIEAPLGLIQSTWDLVVVPLDRNESPSDLAERHLGPVEELVDDDLVLQVLCSRDRRLGRHFREWEKDE